MVSLKYLSNLWRTVKKPLSNCEISLFQNWFGECIIVTGTAGNQEPRFAITDTELYVPFATLSTKDNAKLLQQLETSFKRTINRNKCQLEP